jgi:hypothetical protein
MRASVRVKQEKCSSKCQERVTGFPAVPPGSFSKADGEKGTRGPVPENQKASYTPWSGDPELFMGRCERPIPPAAQIPP